MAEISIKRLAKDLKFDIICDGGKKYIQLSCYDINRPGLFLSGFHTHFDSNRIQLIGTAEHSYLMTMDEENRMHVLEELFSRGFPFMAVSNNAGDVPELKDVSLKYGVPVLKSRTSTATRLTAEMTSYLNKKLAPMETLHAVLLDIYGLGVLITGDSGIGKSEAALELVKRGHRLVADDVVIVKRISEHRLIGEAPDTIKNMMEIRGVGIINVELMYGISATIDSKSIDLIVHLELWDREKDYDRLGTEQDRQEILGVTVPRLLIPVHPGRNLAIIMEAAARYTRLRLSGYNALDEIMERKLNKSEEE